MFKVHRRGTKLITLQSQACCPLEVESRTHNPPITSSLPSQSRDLNPQPSDCGRCCTSLRRALFLTTLFYKEKCAKFERMRCIV